MNEPSLYKEILNQKIEYRDSVIAKNVKQSIRNSICIDAKSIYQQEMTKSLDKPDWIAAFLERPEWQNEVAVPFSSCFFELGENIFNQNKCGIFVYDILGNKEQPLFFRLIYIENNNNKPTIGGGYGSDYLDIVITKKNQIELILPYEEIKIDFKKPPESYCVACEKSSMDMSEDFVNILTFIVILGWLNAKNIKLQANDFNPKYQKHARKHLGINDIKYYTLNVTKPGKQYESTSVNEESQGVMPLHLCRGHLKHYTEEKPLFGKYAGTFFIPAHVRGHKENGTIKKNYKLKTGITI